MSSLVKSVGLILLISLTANLFSATTYNTIGSGNWDDPLAWSGGSVPPNPIAAGITVNINAGHTITLIDSLIIGSKGGGNAAVVNVSGSIVDGTNTFPIILDYKADVFIKSGGDITVDELFMSDKQTGTNPTFTIEGGGKLNLQTLTTGGDFTNSGTVTVDGALNTSTGILINNFGATLTATTFVNDGSITNDGAIYSSNFSGSGTYGGTGTLPIDLVQFTALNMDSHIHLHWVTASELNNDYFTIERSYNAMDFEIIGYRSGAGSSQLLLSYDYMDYSAQGKTLYYRLKQTDYDGNFSYSSIISVNNVVDKTVLDIGSVYLYEDQLNIGINSTANTTLFIELYNSLGSLIYSQKWNNENASSSVKIPLNQYSNGIYIIQLRSNSKSICKKINMTN